MSEYTATIVWERNGAAFSDNRYSRAHRWQFDGGVEVPGSSSTHINPPPLSDPGAVDPEEAFVAALASCHMLCFLHAAATSGYVVESYTDNAVGVMRRNDSGRLAITRVTLRPRAVFAPDKTPGPEQLNKLHHAAHEECFIAASVKSEVLCEPQTD